jgi:hypothetical protein
MATDIKLKRGTSAALQQINPVLAAGEPCLETDTNKIKYGDGVTAWVNLPYANPALTEITGGELFAPVTTGVPTTISGLTVWLQADDETTIQLLNGGVAQVVDKSNTGHHAFQLDSRYRPTHTQLINGKKTITFDSSKTALIGALDSLGEFTAFVVFKPAAYDESGGMAANGRVVAFNQGTNTDTHATGIIPCFISAEDGFGTFVAGDTFGGPDDLAAPDVLYTYCVKRAATTLTTRTLYGTADYTSGPHEISAAAPLDYFALGAARHNYTFGGFAGDIAEVVVYNRVLPQEEENTVIAYLNRWNVAPPTPTGLYADLRGFWPMNELNGIRYDASGSNKHLYLSGTVGYGTDVQATTGVISSAAEFGGGSDFLRNTTPAFFSASFTLSFWVRVSSATTPDVFIQNMQTGSPGSGQFRVGLNNSQYFYADIRLTNRASPYDTSVGLVTVVQNTISVTANTYYYVCLRYNQATNTLSLRVNAATATVSTTGILVPTTNTFNVGVNELGATPPAQTFAVDAIGAWTRALTDEESDFLYNSGDGRETLATDP